MLLAATRTAPASPIPGLLAGFVIIGIILVIVIGLYRKRPRKGLPDVPGIAGRDVAGEQREGQAILRVTRKVFSAGHEGLLRPRMLRSRAVSYLIRRMVAAIFV
jgi:hypothetical protein